MIAENQSELRKESHRWPLMCRPAESRDDYSEAFRLIHRQYCAAHLSRPNPTGMRIAAHQLRPDCETIIVERGDEVIGTLSMIGDSHLGLPLEQYFPEAIDKARMAGFRLLEVGCLASGDRERTYPSPVFGALTRATRQFANRHGFDRTISAVHPRHSKLYERAMGFQRISEVVECEMVEGNLAVCVIGNPTAPHLYVQPWRDIVFGEYGSAFLRRSRSMDSLDRDYFTSVMRIGNLSTHRSNRRAA